MENQVWLKISLTFSIIISFVICTRNKADRNIFRYIAIWLFVPLVILIVLRHEILFHFFIPLLIPIILLASFLIDRLLSKRYVFGLILLAIILLVNLVVFMKNIPVNQNIFFQQNQPEFNIGDQKKVIDAVYKDADNNPFSFQSYTIPYWSQQSWDYLFWQYGEQRYGYFPVPEKAERLYVIIQADPSSKQFQEDWLKYTVSKWGEEVKEFRYGILTIKKLKVDY
jgi:hypothetical protein